jgi:hypothetical protein
VNVSSAVLAVSVGESPKPSPIAIHSCSEEHLVARLRGRTVMTHEVTMLALLTTSTFLSSHSTANYKVPYICRQLTIFIFNLPASQRAHRDAVLCSPLLLSGGEAYSMQTRNDSFLSKEFGMPSSTTEMSLQRWPRLKTREEL